LAPCNLDGCAEIERAAVPAPGAADVCHLPIISVGSYPGDTDSKDLSCQQVWQLVEDGNQPASTESGQTKQSVAVCRLNHTTKTEQATFFTYLRGTSRVGCRLDDQGTCFDCRWEKKILLSSEESTSALGPDGSPIWCVLQATETKLTTHLLLAHILRMHGAIPPLPDTLSWRCAQLRTRITLLHIPSQLSGWNFSLCTSQFVSRLADRLRDFNLVPGKCRDIISN